MSDAPRGRKSKYATEEERKTAMREYQRNYQREHGRRLRLLKKQVAITQGAPWDADVLEALDRVTATLEAELGFRPNTSQMVRYLIKRGGV